MEMRLGRLEDQVDELGQGLEQVNKKVDAVRVELSELTQAQAYNAGQLDFLVKAKNAELNAIKQTVNVNSNNSKNSENSVKIGWPVKAKVGLSASIGVAATAVISWVLSIFNGS